MNAKQRRRERLRASAIEREADTRLMRKIAVIASGCSSLKVARAINGPSVRDVKEESGAMCLPNVALYAAGYRNCRKSATHIIK